MSRKLCQSKFLGLPTELRLLVYEYLFVGKTTTRASSREGITYPHLEEDGVLCLYWSDMGAINKTKGLSVQILRSCRTIYNEGHEFIAKRNVLRVVVHMASASEFGYPKFIKPGKIRYLQLAFTMVNSDLDQNKPSCLEFENIVQGFTNLQDVRIAINLEVNSISDSAKLRGDKKLYFSPKDSNHHNLHLHGVMLRILRTIPEQLKLDFGLWASLDKMLSNIKNPPSSALYECWFDPELLASIATALRSTRIRTKAASGRTSYP